MGSDSRQADADRALPRLIVAWSKTLALGEAYGLSAYEAAYLELALRKGLPLASFDGRLRAVVKKVGGRVLL